jgi:hypothetical protein
MTVEKKIVAELKKVFDFIFDGMNNVYKTINCI